MLEGHTYKIHVSVCLWEEGIGIQMAMKFKEVLSVISDAVFTWILNIEQIRKKILTS